MNKRKDYEIVLSNLKQSQNEEEVIENITKIVKGFTSDYYRNDLYKNPYFKSFIIDIKSDISIELLQIKTCLKEEIHAIDEKLSKLNLKGITSIKHPDISNLRELKRECIILIQELDSRLKDLDNL